MKRKWNNYIWSAWFAWVCHSFSVFHCSKSKVYKVLAIHTYLQRQCWMRKKYYHSLCLIAITFLISSPSTGWSNYKITRNFLNKYIYSCINPLYLFLLWVRYETNSLLAESNALLFPSIQCKTDAGVENMKFIPSFPIISATFKSVPTIFFSCYIFLIIF